MYGTNHALCKMRASADADKKSGNLSAPLPYHDSSKLTLVL